ncbi:MAG TPA: hypothetical protein VMU22_07360 [Rhizomicrobium sp.]|nr:hypothetical protein [Rhizomicrobium sp.]
MTTGDRDEGPGQVELYRLYRERIVHEDDVINHRMMWMLASSTIMFALWGILFAATSQATGVVRIPYLTLVGLVILLVISVCGLFSSWGSRKSIRAAEAEIRDVRKEYLQIPNGHRPGGVLADIVGGNRRHDRGHFVPRVMPGLFIFIWAALAAVSGALLLSSLEPRIFDLIAAQALHLIAAMRQR